LRKPRSEKNASANRPRKQSGAKIATKWNGDFLIFFIFC
jgi:hypothetical protein